jgi:hypothetical protein
MAKVIIGGQMLSLVLALLVTPVFYAILDMWVNFTRRIGIRFAVEPTPSRTPVLGHARANGHPHRPAPVPSAGDAREASGGELVEADRA